MNGRLDGSETMQLKSNSSMLSLTKSIDMASTASTLSIKTNIERTADGRFVVVKKANSVDDEYSSEAISSCSDNDEKLFAVLKGRKSVDDIAFDEDEDSDSDRDSMLDNFDVTLVDENDCYTPKNDAERMFFEVVEVLRYEQEVVITIINK
jgi:enoyl reductase-like protein